MSGTDALWALLVIVVGLWAGQSINPLEHIERYRKRPGRRIEAKRKLPRFWDF